MIWVVWWSLGVWSEGFEWNDWNVGMTVGVLDGDCGVHYLMA